MIKKYQIALAFSIALAACTATPKAKTEKALNAFFDSLVNDHEPGASVLIKKNGQLIYSKSIGLSDVTTQEKITSKTLFNTGSISKTFVANTILCLVAEHKISLEDNLLDFFPDFKNKELAKKVKIHHLLTHTSGLPDNRRAFLDSVQLLTAKDKENWWPIQQCDSLLFEPGSHFEYSNPAFNALALIIEKIERKKWQQVVKEKIFDKSEMKSSVITDGSFPEKGVAHAYVKVNKQFVEKDYGEEPTFAASGNGGVWSSVEELYNYQVALKAHRFLSKDVIDRSQTITRYKNWNDLQPPFIGYSWFLSQPADSLKIISHTGSQGGFCSDFVMLPAKGITYIILCNQPMPILKIRNYVLSTLQKNNWL